MTREQERLRAAQKEALRRRGAGAAARAAPRATATGCSRRARPTEAKVAFDEALGLDPRERRAPSRDAAWPRSASSPRRPGRPGRRPTRTARRSSTPASTRRPSGRCSDAAADPAIAEARELLARDAAGPGGPARAEGAAGARSTRLAARGEELMAAGRFPEAQVAFEARAAARRRATPARARGWPRPSGAPARRSLARWLPNQRAGPRALRAAEGPVDRGADAPRCRASPPTTGASQKVEFRVGGRLIGEFVPQSSPLEPAASVPFGRELPLEPGPERGDGDRDRHRRPLALGRLHRRAAAALPRDPLLPPLGRGRRLHPRRARAGARSGCAGAGPSAGASTPTSRARPSSTTTCSSAARSSPRAC